MATKIVNAAVSTDKSISSSIEHAAEAAKKCIREAGIDTQEVDYLINCGVYRDYNYVEPGICSLIMKKIGLSLDHVKYPVDRTAFGCDLMNGAVGPLNAMHLADSLVKSKKAKYVLVVASEAHPSMNSAVAFPYTSMGSAILLGEASSREGFNFFHFSSSDDAENEGEGYVELKRYGLESRYSIDIDQSRQFEDNAMAELSKLVQPLIDSQTLKVEKSAFITAQHSEEFNHKLANIIKVDETRVIDTYSKWRNTLTSSYALGYLDAMNRNDLAELDSLCFIGSGFGVVTGIVNYTL